MATTPTAAPVSPAAPAAPAAAQTFDQKFDSIFGTAPAAPPAPVVEPPTAVPPVEGAPPEGTPPAEGVIPVEPPADDSDIESQMTKEGEQHKPNWLDLNSPRGRTIYYDGHKAVRAVEDHVGYKPSADDIKSWYDRQSQVDEMETDFTSPDPAHMQNFIAQWHQRSPEGMQRMAAMLPNYLEQADPNSYRLIEGPILGRYERSLFADAEREAQVGNLKLANSLWHAGSMLEWKRTGAFRPSPYVQQAPGQAQPTAQPQAQQPQVDPALAREREQLALERQRIQQFQAQQAQQAQQSFIDNTTATVHTSVLSLIDDALKSIKDSQSPEYYELYRDKALKEIQANVPKSGGRFTEYRNAFERAVRSPSSDSQQHLVTLYSSMAAKVMQSIRPKLLDLAAKDLSARTAQAHAQMGRVSAQVAPSTGAAPVPATPTLQAPQGARGEAAREAMLNQLLGIPNT